MQIHDSSFKLHSAGGNSATFLIHDIDESGDPRYYGYSNSDGSWVIQEYNEGNGTFRYQSGKRNYSTNWTNKASLSYDYLSEVV
jgi:hypothetical protein